jgi:hypothetical protein
MKAFLITIDTEGDNLWSRPHDITTRNAAFVRRFQHLSEAFGFKPTWLVNHEMATSAVFTTFAWDVLKRDAGEIGMHLHAWNSPPIEPLTGDDLHHQPFLTDYPDAVMEAKIDHMTRLLRGRFGAGVVSHRGGRWALDARYAQMLVRHGYLVDCSVTPHVDWRGTPGAPQGPGGPDFRHFPSAPYRIDPQRIDRPGASPLLEVPMSVRPSRLRHRAPLAYEVPLLRRLAWRHRPPLLWLYPDGRNLGAMLELVDAVRREGEGGGGSHLEMVLHSSELMPGGSPQSPDEAAIERLYADLEVLFHHVARDHQGMTLSEFRAQWLRHQPQEGDRRAHPRGPQRRSRTLAFIPQDRRATAEGSLR